MDAEEYVCLHDSMMREHYCLFFVVFLFARIVGGIISQENNYIKKNDFSNKLCSTGQLFGTHNVNSVFKCAKLCALNSDCLSFFYNRNGSCQYHDTVLIETISCIGLSETLYYIRGDYIPATSTALPETTSVSLIDTSTAQLSCGADWMSIGASCYKVTPGSTSLFWDVAKAYCISIGGYLAVLDTEKETQDLKDYLVTLRTKDYYIGATDLETEGIFKWDNTGELLNLPRSSLFHDWFPPSQPDNGKSNANQHCVVVFGGGGYKWNDVQCTYAREYICESNPV